jgi:hypothetical protein
MKGNNNLRKNDWKPTYHKALSSTIHELLQPFLVVITSHMRFNKKLYRAWLASKNRNLQNKNIIS